MCNQFITHPDGGICFGKVPEMNIRGIIIPSGDIRLIPGKHVGPNKGRGAEHIWSEHQREMHKKGFVRYEDVPAYVASIIVVGTKLYFEGGQIRQVRLMAVQSQRGVAILEHRTPRDGEFWSIITAYSGGRPYGTLVGAVR